MLALAMCLDGKCMLALAMHLDGGVYAGISDVS